MSSPDEIRQNGFWWLPGSPERQIPGQLTYGHQTSPELELLGSMHDSWETLKTLGRWGSTYKPEIILGRTSDGKDVTLVECMRSGFNFSTNSFPVERFMPTIVIVGRHFEKVQDIVFHHMTLSLSHLDEWCQRTGRQVAYGSDDEQVTTLTLTYKRPESLRIDFGSGLLEFGHGFGFYPARFGGDFVVSEEACFTLYPVSPLGLFEFLDKALPPITCFIFLGLGTACSIKKVYAKAASDCVGKSIDDIRAATSVELFWNKKHLKSDDKQLFSHDMVFTCPQLSDDFARILTNWSGLYAAIRPVMQLYFGRVIYTDGYSANSFLNSVQAAEAFHRYRRNGDVEPRETHDARLESIYDSAPPEHLIWLKQKLSSSNKKGLAPRLGDLLSEHAELFLLSQDDIKKISTRIRNMRDFFTHYSGTKLDFGEGHEFYTFGGLLKWLLMACLLEEVGIEKTMVHSWLENCQPFIYFRGVNLKQQHLEVMKVDSVPASEVPPLE